MPKFNLLLVSFGLFLTTIITIVTIGSSVAAFPVDRTAPTETRSTELPSPQTIAQRITSPGLTQPIPTPPLTPTPIPTTIPGEAPPIPIPVPAPKNPLPSSPPTPNPTPTPIPPTIPAPTPIPTPTPTPDRPSDRSGKILTPEERDKISNYLRSRNLSTVAIVNALPDPRFILHDTSVVMSPSVLERERQIGRGPLGLGVNAYLPRENAAVLARPNFYEPRRPTTTEFEKASDILVKADRERLLRRAWQLANGDARRQALDTALANLNLSSAEIAKEQREASEKLAASSGRIFTTATWSVEAICTRYNSGDRSVLNSASQEDQLRSACGTLTNYFNIRNSRVKSTVAAEIVQVGVRSERGNQNTCSASNSNIATLPNPPYSDNQYNDALSLYLRATLAAGKFPQTTTHFALDTFDPEAHCDPRCFNLNKLYDSISSVMGHARGSSYGIKPSYGSKLGVNNIWWNDRICHGSPPQ